MGRSKAAKAGYKPQDTTVVDTTPAAEMTDATPTNAEPSLNDSLVEPNQAEDSKVDSTMELKNALADIPTADLLEMAKRLHRSCEQMTEFVQESEQESKELQKENKQLHEAIDMWAKETKKLNISSSNLVDPALDEGPLDFVGRYWEQFRPRDNQVLLNEHVGELKRNQHEVPGSLDNAVGKLQEAAAQAADVADLEILRTEVQAKVTDLQEQMASFDSNMKAQAADLKTKVEGFNESFREQSLRGFNDIAEKVGTLDDLSNNLNESLTTHATSFTEKGRMAADRVKEVTAQNLNGVKEVTAQVSLNLNGITEKVGGFSALWGNIDRDNFDQEETKYASDDEGSEGKMMKNPKPKSDSTSSAILNSATPLSKDKRDMIPQSESGVDTDTFRWLTKEKDGEAGQVGSQFKVMDGLSGITEKFTAFSGSGIDELKTQAAELKEKMNTFDADAFRETSVSSLNELKSKSLNGLADMTVSMGFGGLSRMFGGSSSTQDPVPPQQQQQNNVEDPASRQVMMSKDDDVDDVPALNPKASNAFTSSSPAHDTPEAIQEEIQKEEIQKDTQEDTCVLEEKLVPSTDVVIAQKEQEQQEHEDEVCSSVLIEAHLTLDDGSVEVLRLRAVDRSVDVAAKFLRDQGLKEQQFKDPLTAWLKSVESSAETFPVKAKGDLFEIRQEFSKKKQEHGKSKDGSETFG
jgi:hypothetical protein